MRMNSNKYVALFVIILLLAIGWLLLSGADTTVPQDLMEQDDPMLLEQAGAAGGEVVTSEVMVATDSPLAPAGVYAPYSEAAVADAEEGVVVLFFKASWCSTCRALDRDITESLGEIPAGVTILTVDYDTALDLRKQYGVTIQHTLVQVDAAGTLLKKWGNSSTLEAVVAQIQ